MPSFLLIECASVLQPLSHDLEMARQQQSSQFKWAQPTPIFSGNLTQLWMFAGISELIRLSLKLGSLVSVHSNTVKTNHRKICYHSNWDIVFTWLGYYIKSCIVIYEWKLNADTDFAATFVSPFWECDSRVTAGEHAPGDQRLWHWRKYFC